MEHFRIKIPVRKGWKAKLKFHMTFTSSFSFRKSSYQSYQTHLIHILLRYLTDKNFTHQAKAAVEPAAVWRQDDRSLVFQTLHCRHPKRFRQNIDSPNLHGPAAEIKLTTNLTLPLNRMQECSRVQNVSIITETKLHSTSQLP